MGASQSQPTRGQDPPDDTPRRVGLRRRISSFIRRDEADRAKRERSNSYQSNPARPVPKRRRVGGAEDDGGMEDEPAFDGPYREDQDAREHAQANQRLDAILDEAPSAGPSRPSTASPGIQTAFPEEPPRSPTDEILSDRLRTVSTIRDALGPEWRPQPASSYPGSGLFSRLRHRREMQQQAASRAHLAPPPPTPPLSTGSTPSAASTAASSLRSAPPPGRGLSHRLSAIMGFATPSSSEDLSEPSEPQENPTPSASQPAPPSEESESTRIPVGAVLVIQGLAQTHANVDASGRPERRVDVPSLDQQARMIGNLLTVAAAATATTLLSPESLPQQPSRSTAQNAMHTIIDRLRPQRNRAAPTVESALGDYLRTVLHDNRRFAEAASGDAPTGNNVPAEFQQFLQTLQEDLIQAVRAYAVAPEESVETAEDVIAADAAPTPAPAVPEPEPKPENEASATEDNGEAASSSSPSQQPEPAEPPIPTFHHQPGQIRHDSAERSLGVSGGTDGLPRRLNFFRAHLFPTVHSNDQQEQDEEDAVVPSIFVGVRSISHGPGMTTEDLVGHPSFPFLDGQVPSVTEMMDEETPQFDRDLERETQQAVPVSPTMSGERRTLRERVLERFTARREARTPAPLNTYLIYVIGGNYPQSHPVLAIPALISGGPLSDEDLQLVSELLGPAKPPTATAEEIERSGLQVVKGSELPTLVADGKVLDASAERCMICLSDYETDDDCRVLKCRHAFHKECVDHWLSAGRNSCPSCRTEAVEKNASPPSAESASAAAPAATPSTTNSTSTSNATANATSSSTTNSSSSST